MNTPNTTTAPNIGNQTDAGGGTSNSTTSVNAPTNAGGSTSVSVQNNWTNQVYVSSKTYQTTVQNVIYPQVNGLQNQAVQAQINTLLKTSSISVPAKETSYASSYTWSSSYNVVFQQGDIMDFLLTSYFSPVGAAHGTLGRTSLIVNLKTGQVYSLKDVFQRGSNYLGAMSNVIAKEDTHHILDTFQKFTGVTNQDTIFLVPNGLGVDFSPGEWTPFAQGFLDYTITFASVTNLLNKNGSFWQALNDAQGFPSQNYSNEIRARISSLGYSLSTDLGFSTMEYIGNGQYVTAWVGTQNTAPSIAGQKVFFFLNGTYLGTDTAKAHGYVTGLAPSGPGTIAVTYGSETLNGKPFTIQYQWNGSKLVANGFFPSKYTWY